MDPRSRAFFSNEVFKSSCTETPRKKWWKRGRARGFALVFEKRVVRDTRPSPPFFVCAPFFFLFFLSRWTVGSFGASHPTETAQRHDVPGRTEKREEKKSRIAGTSANRVCAFFLLCHSLSARGGSPPDFLVNSVSGLLSLWPCTPSPAQSVRLEGQVDAASH